MNVVLDACVLYPAPLRDFLLNLADLDLFEPKWTQQIHEEWTTNLLKNRKDIMKSQLSRTKRLMTLAFPNSIVTEYEGIIDQLKLLDQNDRHVLAAAIKSKSNQIVTFNLKDFPSSYLRNFDITAIHPDEFALDLFKQNKKRVEDALVRQIESLKNPPLDRRKVMSILESNGLIKIMAELSKPSD